ncbi:nickel pincer cofactor biosynthesis protein LarC [Stackebrandtia nassauensis]|uniref:Pyridinium-3,5-bisthiocarboxylic acid mononucleotide nickel insertion protein n=1 Tax=Stackebrandtia nassauensis (strain DSM 44728 / CIP 108903 / NRRL B-16338 / NBRC 102104 / LLR-40K-21) TaxID=446470 RepID=D3Q5L5_STANL|nr:nickel pincer cofactor biosynthesis protein LarC [Stackebrandtia nassauensis]ADD46075.1 protein of unknown function DUF111 [Stackebrandtia nassauensis DSM 44728]
MICWIDAAAGASGDMFLGALVDAGVPLEVLRASVDALGVEPVRLTATETTRHGLAATKVDVDCPQSTIDRRYASIVRLITEASLPQPVRDKAIDVFTRLGHAEAAAHRVRLDDVHFHEVGALDSLADVVAACAGLHWLAENRGLGRIVCSAVTAGGGVTRGAHGGIPLPAPATLAVLSRAKAPVAGEVSYEACTPTGAAIIAAHATAYGTMPLMTVDAVGVGAGGRDPAERANVLRLVLGSQPTRADHAHSHGHHHAAPTVAAGDRPSALVMEANVDDLDPRLWPQVLAALLAAGASDAWLTPILMKKGRPAHTLSVLCGHDVEARVRSAIFAHTSTIGLRVNEVGKHALDREYGSIVLDGQTIGVKLARDDGRIVNVSVEHADVEAAATALDLPVKVVLARASGLAAESYGAA